MTAALLALAPGLAHAQAGDDPLARGRELRVAGRAAEAVPLLEQAARAAPNDPDVWLHLGLAYSAAHQADQAEEALARAQALAPAYPDVLVARARLAFFRGDLDEAERRLAKAPDLTETRQLRAQISAARADRNTWRLDAALSRGRLTGELPDATGGNLSLTRRLAAGQSVTGTVEYVRQFGREDVYVEAVRAWRLGYVAVGGAADADFRPELAVRAGVSAPAFDLAGGWKGEVGADASWARYPVGPVRGLHPYAAVSRGDDLRLQARWINVLDERDQHRSGYSLSLAWRPATGVGLSLGWADAPESSLGVTTQAEVLTAGVSFDLDATTTLRLGAGHERRPAYGRSDLTLAVTRRF